MQVKYFLTKEGTFVIENYNFSSPFASFFCGIAGLWGIPMWIFYVNRYQCITSFGIESKNNPLLEFEPADKAFVNVGLKGFRTFLKFTKNKLIYEPFRPQISQKIFQRMLIDSHKLTLEEINKDLNIVFKVKYFLLPSEKYASLVRILEIINLGSPSEVQLIDGLPLFLCSGVDNKLLKFLSYTVRSWMQTESLEGKINFYKVRASIKDTPQVFKIKEGNFFTSFTYKDQSIQFLKILVDPNKLFGQVTDFSFPHFLDEDFEFPQTQLTESQNLSAFGFWEGVLETKKELRIISLYGYMKDKSLYKYILDRISNPKYIEEKETQAFSIIESIKNYAFTVSDIPEFDFYIQQSFLDNSLRGGIPHILEGKDKKIDIFVFSRKHGDLERDYNNFKITPTFFSQGEGNFRDLNQNRRNDLFFNPQVFSSNVSLFFNLIQPDGFNPLLIKVDDFYIKDSDKLTEFIEKITRDSELKEELRKVLSGRFHLGELLTYLSLKEEKLNMDLESILRELVDIVQKEEIAKHKEGFWIDHFSYNLDLLENFLSIYPDKLKYILLEKKDFYFYDTLAYVVPRDEKYVLVDGTPQQLFSVARIEEKRELLYSRKRDIHKVRLDKGKGEVFYTNLLIKILVIILNKISSFDPFGRGIEMEADKPSWCDALNGLPALFGSSVSEVFELKRLIEFLSDSLKKLELNDEYEEKVPLEIFKFFHNLKGLLKEYLESDSTEKDFLWYKRSTGFKEIFREEVKFGFSLQLKSISIKEILDFLEKAKCRVAVSIQKNFDPTNKLYYSYFINKPVKFKKTQKKNRFGYETVEIERFEQIPLPLFLEPQVHAMKVCDKKTAKELYQKIKESPLYDEKLKMFKICENLEKMPLEIGRIRAFSRGWLENESIWLHMEYKFLLELLKKGLYEEFFTELKNTLVCFQPPHLYKRNILENSSFIVSSAFPDESFHGKGFIARLTGANAEVLSIWTIMCAGLNPFYVKDGQLIFKLSPVLKSEFFTRKSQERIFYRSSGETEKVVIPEKSFAFKFLGKILVIYKNENLKDTFLTKVKKYILEYEDKKVVEILRDCILQPYSLEIREGKVKKIIAILE